MSTAVSGSLDAPSFIRRSVSRVGLGVLCAYAAVYVAWTVLHWSGDRTTVSDVAPIPLALAATWLAWRAAHDTHVNPRRRSAWQCIAFGCASWTIAECLWLSFEVIRHTTPFPSPADWFSFAFYAFVFAGLVRLPVAQLGKKERVAFTLDLATVMLVTLMTVWYLVVEPTLHGNQSLLNVVLSLAYPAGDVVLVLGVARVLMRRRSGGEGHTALWFLVGGSLLVACADIISARLELANAYSPGTLPDALWMLALLAIALAAFTELSPVPARPQLEESGDVSQPVSKLPYLAVMVGLVLVLNETSRDVSGPLAVLVLGALGLTVIVVARQVTVLRDNEHLVHKLRRLAHTDALTGLANRRQLFEMAPRLVTAAHRKHESVTVVMVDIDNFKEINDRYGHAAGDEVVRAVAMRGAAALRTTDLLARYGGDEFVAVITGDVGEYRREIATRLRQTVGDDGIETAAGLIATTVSVGVATSSVARLERLLHEADAALLRAKRSGRNTVFRAPRVGHATEPVPGGHP